MYYMKIVKQRLTLNLLNKVGLVYPVFVQTMPMINQTHRKLNTNVVNISLFFYFYFHYGPPFESTIGRFLFEFVLYSFLITME